MPPARPPCTGGRTLAPASTPPGALAVLRSGLQLNSGPLSLPWPQEAACLLHPWDASFSRPPGALPQHTHWSRCLEISQHLPKDKDLKSFQEGKNRKLPLKKKKATKALRTATPGVRRKEAMPSNSEGCELPPGILSHQRETETSTDRHAFRNMFPLFLLRNH